VLPRRTDTCTGDASFDNVAPNMYFVSASLLPTQLFLQFVLKAAVSSRFILSCSGQVKIHWRWSYPTAVLSLRLFYNTINPSCLASRYLASILCIMARTKFHILHCLPPNTFLMWALTLFTGFWKTTGSNLILLVLWPKNKYIADQKQMRTLEFVFWFFWRYTHLAAISEGVLVPAPTNEVREACR
jgi:hypothetical protein